jgi:enoyl-CoA hydratase/carnithine racemase
MGMIIVDQTDDVVMLKLNRSVTNPINLDLVTQLKEHISHVRQIPAIRAVVLTSTSEKFFSIGFDIPQLIALGEAGFQQFYHAYNELCLELFTMPKPTIAALPGHAIAGGYILALCCDRRIIGEGRKLVGLNEVKLGVPVPYVADCILRSIAGGRRARDIMETGDFFPPEQAIALGMVDEVVDASVVIDEAINKARIMGSLPETAFSVIKENRLEPIEAEIRARLREKEDLFLHCWFSKTARSRLEAAVDKF